MRRLIRFRETMVDLGRILVSEWSIEDRTGDLRRHLAGLLWRVSEPLVEGILGSRGGPLERLLGGPQRCAWGIWGGAERSAERSFSGLGEWWLGLVRRGSDTALQSWLWVTRWRVPAWSLSGGSPWWSCSKGVVGRLPGSVSPESSGVWFGHRGVVVRGIEECWFCGAAECLPSRSRELSGGFLWVVAGVLGDRFGDLFRGPLGQFREISQGGFSGVW